MEKKRPKEHLWATSVLANTLDLDGRWFRAPCAYGLIQLQTVCSVFLMNCKAETASWACAEELFRFCFWLEKVTWSLVYLSAEGSQVYQTLISFLVNTKRRLSVSIQLISGQISTVWFTVVGKNVHIVSRWFCKEEWGTKTDLDKKVESQTIWLFILNHLVQNVHKSWGYNWQLI